jgi:hypothetical protein
MNTANSSYGLIQKDIHSFIYSIQGPFLSLSFPYYVLKILNIKIYIITILPYALNGCGTWFLTLSEVYNLRVSENRVLRRIFVSKRKEFEEGWRRLYNEEL